MHSTALGTSKTDAVQWKAPEIDLQPYAHARLDHALGNAESTRYTSQRESAEEEDHGERTQQELPQAAEAPADGGTQAWIQVAASFLINLNVYGLVNAFGEFQHYYETVLLSSYSSSTISWIGTMQAALTLFVGALAGPLFDRGYFRVTLQGAAITLVFSWFMLSLSSKYYQIMLTQGVLAGICVGLMEVPSIALISDYFRKKRGLALGMAISGAPAGGLIYSAVFRATLTASNFAWATRTIGFIVFATLAVAVIIIRPKDAKKQASNTSQKLIDLSAFRELPFNCFFFDAFFAYCAALVPYFISPSFAVAIGLDSNAASYIVTVLNAAQFFGRLIPAWLSDIYGGEDMLLVAQFVVALLGFHWITVSTSGGFVEFIIFIGVFSGMVATLPATVIPYISPNPESLGTRIGVVYASAGLGVLIGNPIALATSGTGHIHDRGGFLGAQLWMAICALIGAVLFIIPSRSAKKNRMAASIKN